MALRWCRANMGIDESKEWQPIWHVVIDRYGQHIYGEYDAEDNEIFIYWTSIPTVEDLIRTIIHEWQHQLQPIKGNYHKHKCYKNNPFEVEARKAEEVWFRPCWNAVRTKVNKNLKNGLSNRKTKRGRSSANE
jgi:hypothetical protein